METDTPTPEYVFDVTEEGGIRKVVATARAFALELGFGSYESANISLAVSEIVTNAVRYGKNATAIIQCCSNGRGVEVVVEDTGPGIENLDRALQDGFSSRPQKSLGMGLGAAKRAVDEFDIDTSPAGTKVVLRKYLEMPPSDVDTGVVSYAAVHGVANGDQYIIKKYEGDKLLVAVVDGAGQGAGAQLSAKAITTLIAANYKAPLDYLLQEGHKKLCESQFTRGAEVALVRVTGDEIEYIVMGSLRVYVASDPKISISIHDGSLGVALPSRLRVVTEKRPAHFSLVLHSDGVSGVDYASELAESKSAQKMAESVFDRYALATDDATVIVLSG